jgi:SARP family transcriptional regulator, regulator of embCAB operon
MPEPRPRPLPVAAARSGADAGPRVAVLGGFRFWDGGRALLALTGGSQRLLAFLAIRRQATTRAQAAGTLFPTSTGEHASGSLRTTLARLEPAARRAVLATLTDVCLAEGVAVDLRESRALAQRLLDTAQPLHPRDLEHGSVGALSDDLLPGWYDDWMLVEAEDWRQLRLHALEALASRLTGAHRYAEAASAALAAIAAEPLRESARGVLIRVHLAEGNQSEALREYERYRSLLQAELGLEPTARLRADVAGAMPGDL